MKDVGQNEELALVSAALGLGVFDYFTQVNDLYIEVGFRTFGNPYKEKCSTKLTPPLSKGKLTWVDN